MTRASNIYMPQLDGLRALAVASVLVYHWFMPPIALGQWGVTLFFVLSGYLITRNIAALRESGMPVATAARIFFVRRTLRLFPAYYLVVLIAALLYDDIRRDWVWYAAYVSNILMEKRPHFSALKASWSLSVEEQFYVVWFFVMMCVPAKRIPWIIAVAFIAEPLVRCPWLIPDFPAFRTWTLWANCDGIVLGALLYLLESRGREFPVSPAAVALLTVSLAIWAALVPPQSPGYSPIASVLVSTLCAWIVWRTRQPLGGIFGRVLSNRSVVYVGRISYGVYLYHIIVPGLADALGITRLPLVWRFFEAHSLQGFITHCVIVIALAGVSFRYFEMPLRSLGLRATTTGTRVGTSVLR